METLKKFSNKEVTHKKENDIEYLTFNALENEKVDCFVTLRHGGVSKDVYKSLNFRTASKDNIDNIFKNLDLLCGALKLDNKDIVKAKQSHTDNILVLDKTCKEKYEFNNLNDEEIDGYITCDKSIIPMVVTADCNGILLYDKACNALGLVHSGWKGTVKKIYLKAIHKMKENYNTRVENLIVCVSPSILKCCFSSEDEEFKKIFTNIWTDEENYIYYEKENPKRFHIDLSYVITKDLLECGVKKENIHFAGICTCCNHEDFYSFRHKTQVGESDYGLMATIAKLK